MQLNDRTRTKTAATIYRQVDKPNERLQECMTAADSSECEMPNICQLEIDPPGTAQGCMGFLSKIIATFCCKPCALTRRMYRILFLVAVVSQSAPVNCSKQLSMTGRSSALPAIGHQEPIVPTVSWTRTRMKFHVDCYYAQKGLNYAFVSILGYLLRALPGILHRVQCTDCNKTWSTVT